MGRPKGTKNIMRTPEEKEKLILEYFNSGIGYARFAENHDIDRTIFLKWVQKYRENGIDGLKNNSGKNSIGRPKGKLSQLEKLQKEILELRIENER